MIIDCFGTDRQAMDDIKALFMQSLLKLAKDGNPLDFKSVYKDVMDSNVIPDIDIESAAFLYQEIRTEAYSLDKNIGSHMTSEAELDKIHSDANLKSVFKKGSKDSPASSIAKGVLSYLRNVGERGSGNEKDASKVRKIVADYAKSVLGVNRTGKTVDILAEAIERDMKGTDFKDHLSYDNFFDKLKEELQDTLSKVKDPVVRRSLDNELNKLKKASFKMGITETGRKKVLYDILKEKYGKDTKSGRVVDWNAIAAQENPIAALKDALSDKLDKLGYKGDKNKIYEALQDEIEGIRNTNAYAKAITAMNLQGTTIVKRLAEEVAIARGFFTKTGGVNGKKVVKYDVENQIAISEVMAEMKALGLIYDPNKMDNNFELLVSRYIKDKNISKIRGSILKLMAHNNKPFKAKVGEIDRLVKLNRKAGLDGTTSVLAGKILNISVNAVTMARMETLVNQFEKLMSYDKTDVDQMKELFPWYDLNEAYTPAIFASNAMQDIVKEMGILVIDAAVRDLGKLPTLMVFLRRWQQTVLANRLTNLPNITQNILGGGSGMRAAGEDFVKRAKKANKVEVDGIKEVLDTFKKYFTQDLTGESGTVRGYGIKNIYDAKTRGEKALAGINMLSTGILSSIDGYFYAQGVSRAFYNNLRENLRIKFEEDGRIDPKKIDAEIDKVLFPYFSAEYGEKAILLAKHYLGKVGVTEASMGTERYARTVAAEAENIRRSFFMSGPITNYISPERVQSAKKIAERMTEMELGKKDYHVMVDGKKERKSNAWIFGSNIAGTWIDAMDAQYNKALNALIKDNSSHNAWKFVVISGATLIAHGGPLAFLSGATRWADKAFGSLVNAPFYALTNKVGRAKKRFKEVATGVTKPGEKAYNEDDIIAHYEEYEIARRRMKQSIEALVVSATFLAAGIMIVGSWGGDDDDDDGYWERLWKAIEGLMDSKFAQTPMGETVMKRIMPLHVRILYAISKSKKWDNFYNAQRNAETLSNVLYTHVPSTAGSLFTRYYRAGDTKQDVAGKIFKEVQGAIFSLSPIINPLGWTGISNPVIDQIRGSKKRVDYSNHPLLSRQGSTYDGKFIDGVADGMAWGLTDYAMGYFLDSRGAMRTTGMEILPEDYKKKFSDIDWSKYGESKYNAKKDAVEKTLPRLDRVAEEIENFGRAFDIPEFKERGSGKLAYTRYYNGIFSVSVKNVNLQKLKQYSGEKPSESGNINVLRVALNRVGLKDINIDEAEIAIKWRNLQEKL